MPLSELPADASNEIASLTREYLKAQPADFLQFSANYFQKRLESQRTEFHLIQQQSSAKGGGMAASNFPGSNPFGSPSNSVSAGAGMGSLEEEDENDVMTSPTAASFPRSVLDKPPTSTDAKNPFGNFGGFSGGSQSTSTGASSTFGATLGAESFPSNYNVNRRTSVSAESLQPTNSQNDNWTPPFHKKTDEQQARLKEATSKIFLFSGLDEKQYAQVLGALQEKPIPKAGIKVISQGDVGDFFYIVDTGSFEIYVNKSGKLESGTDGLGQKVATVGVHGYFGELALMYNAPRAATVVSTEASTLWALDRVTFKRILTDSAFEKRRMYEDFLERVELLKPLTPQERSKIADALREKKVPDGTTIITQGDIGESFYILEHGTVDVYKRTEQGDSQGGDGKSKIIDGVSHRWIGEYTEKSNNNYFGDLALLYDQPRAATIVSRDAVTLAVLNKDGFQRLLGPVQDQMRFNDPSKSQAQANRQ